MCHKERSCCGCNLRVGSFIVGGVWFAVDILFVPTKVLILSAGVMVNYTPSESDPLQLMTLMVLMVAFSILATVLDIVLLCAVAMELRMVIQAWAIIAVLRALLYGTFGIAAFFLAWKRPAMAIFILIYCFVVSGTLVYSAVVVLNYARELLWYQPDLLAALRQWRKFRRGEEPEPRSEARAEAQSEARAEAQSVPVQEMPFPSRASSEDREVEWKPVVGEPYYRVPRKPTWLEELEVERLVPRPSKGSQQDTGQGGPVRLPEETSSDASASEEKQPEEAGASIEVTAVIERDDDSMEAEAVRHDIANRHRKPEGSSGQESDTSQGTEEKEDEGGGKTQRSKNK